ncbi:MAG: hypothetical protein HFJ47_03555 [Clostridia bacterium]|nr:hypothetical protein [Clostridia bacterium]
MVNNTEEKSLTIIKEKNIFTKVIGFFHKIFNRKKKTCYYDAEINLESKTTTNRSFMALDSIEVKFQNFRNGYIKEEDLTEDEKIELTKMFQQRIKQEQEEIEYLKKKILEVRAQYLKLTNS